MLLAVTALRAQGPLPADVPVNLDPAGSQALASAVVDNRDRLLIAWKDSSASGSRIILQAFDRKGGRLGDTLIASEFPSARKGRPVLAVNFTGQAVAAWSDGLWPASRVYFRRFTTSGTVLDSTSKPNTGTRVIRGRALSVAADSAGNTLLVWEDESTEGFDIFASRFAFSDLLGQGSTDTTVHQWAGNHRLSTSTAGDQLDPSLAVDHKGNAVVAWRDFDPDSTGLRLAAYDARGRELFQRLIRPSDLSPVTGVSPPSVTRSYLSSANSEFLVSWVESDTSGMRRLKLFKLLILINRLPQIVTVDSAAFVVDSGTALPLRRPSLSANEDGNVTILWSGSAGNVHFFSFGLQGLEGARSGVLPIEGTNPARPVAAIRPDGYFVGIWEDSSQGLPDLWMQNFSPEGIIDDPMHISPGGGEELAGSAALAGHPDRSFTLFWERQTSQGAKIEQLSFDPQDRPLGAAQPMLPDTRNQRRPVSAVSPNGGYVIAWQESGAQDYRTRASLFTPSGEAINEGIVLEQSSQSYLGGAASALGPSGAAYLAWERWAPLAKAPDLVLARLDSLGSPRGAQLTVMPASQGGGRFASIAVGAGGYHMLLWRQGAVQGSNAYIRGRVYGPDGNAAGPDLRVSSDMTEFIGSSGRPAAVASPVTGRFMVVWQEFFADRQRLYYRLYSETGDSLEIPGGTVDSLTPENPVFRGVFDGGTQTGVSQTSPALAVDSRGDHLILWVEKQVGGNALLLGRKIDSLGRMLGSTFQVPGVQAATQPVVSILGPDRVALAWLDTVSGHARLLVQSLQINFSTLSGKIALSSLHLQPEPVLVHIEGNVVDSAAVSADGSFRFQTLTDGSYRLWATSGRRELMLGRTAFNLSGGGNVDLGRIDVLDAPGPDLPRSAGLVLRQNEPNPFNPSTTITFELPDEGVPMRASLRVYDLRGAIIRVLLDEELSGGKRSVQWDGRDGRGREVASGVYFYRLSHGEHTAVRKMILLK